MATPSPRLVQEVAAARPVADLRFALAACGIGEANGYRLAKHHPEELPFKVLRVGRIYKVPTSSLLDALGLSPLADPTRQPAA